MHSKSSIGSWPPLQELYAIIGGGGAAPTESDLKHQHDDEALQCRKAGEAEQLRQEEDARRDLQDRSRHIQRDILQTKMGDQDVFTTPQ